VPLLVELTGVWSTGPVLPETPVRTARAIQVPAGSSATVRIRLVDQDGLPVILNLAGTDLMQLSIAPTTGGGETVRKLAAASGVENYAYDVAITVADTQWLSGFNIYDVWVDRAGDKQQVIAPGYWDASFRVPSSVQ
jgi:hypothetical protein